MADPAKTLIHRESTTDEPTMLIQDDGSGPGRDTSVFEGSTLSLDLPEPFELGSGLGSEFGPSDVGGPIDASGVLMEQDTDVPAGADPEGRATEMEFGFAGQESQANGEFQPPQFAFAYQEDALEPLEPLEQMDVQHGEEQFGGEGEAPTVATQERELEAQDQQRARDAAAPEHGGFGAGAPLSVVPFELPPQRPQNPLGEQTSAPQDQGSGGELAAAGALDDPSQEGFDPLSMPLSDAFVPPPDVSPPAKAKGNPLAFLFNASHNAGKWVGGIVGALAVLVLVSPAVLPEEDLRHFAQTLGAESMFVSLGLIPEVATDLGANASSFEPSGPVVQPEPNQEYFNQVSEALRQGDPEKAARLMEKRPTQLLETRFDLDKAAEMSARFYLMVGKEEQALRAISARCGVDGGGASATVVTCLPLLRSYLSLGRLPDASRTLAHLRNASDAADYPQALDYAQTALSAAQQGTPKAVTDHLLSFLKPTSMEVEWERQISAWILRDFARLGHRRWRDVAQLVFQIDRAKFEEAMSPVALESGRYVNAFALTRFLDFLALRFGHEPFELKHGAKMLPLDDTRLGLTLNALSKNLSADISSVSHSLQMLRGSRPYSEVERLIAVNLALQEKSWNKAYQILNSQVEEIPNSRFSFEWKLAGAAFAIGSNNEKMARTLEQAIFLFGEKTPKVKDTFDYWYSLARLQVSFGKNAERAVASANSFADSEREQGLVAALRLMIPRDRGTLSGSQIDRVVQQYPKHDSVLEAAILASGRQGRDPGRYMNLQNRLTAVKLAAGREKNLLLDTTVEDLLRHL